MDEVLATVYQYVAEFGLKLIAAVAILIVGRWFAKALSGVVEQGLVRVKVDSTLTSFITRFSYLALFTFVVIAALGQFIETTSVIAVVGAAGLAVGLALQGTLSNFAAGIMLVIFRPFSIGDMVEIGHIKGKVKEIHVFSTIIDSPDNCQITCPNSHILGGNIINFTKYRRRRIDLVIGVGYEDDLKKAKKVIMKILTDHEKVLEKPEPLVAVSELADSSVNFIVRPWTKTADYFATRCDLTEQIKIALDKNGISIPYPQQDLHLVSTCETKRK